MLSALQAARNWAYNLRRIREAKGFSKKDLARQAEMLCNNEEQTINVSYITRYENFGMAPRLDHLLNIATVLQVKVDELLKPKAPANFRLKPRPKKSVAKNAA